MSKFKVGDRVVVVQVRNGAPEDTVGRIGRVVTILDEESYTVKFGGSVRWSYSDDELEIIRANETTSPAIPPHYTADSTELSGGLNSYYLVEVSRPQRDDQPPYIAECEDIIGALDLNFDEGNIFKAIWRAANARKGNGKAGHVPKYDAEKVYHSAGRILKRNS